MKTRGQGGRGQSEQNSEKGFTRLDLGVVIGIVALLALWFGCLRFGEQGRTTRCQENLMRLGKGMHGYANEHDRALPIAGINVGKVQSSWDMEIFLYVKSGLTKASDAQLAETVPQLFACPSDTIYHKSYKRSYAMAGNDMTPGNWPPGRASSTGVGLFWDKRTVLALLDEDALNNPKALPVIKLSSIPVPADTVLLADYVDGNNTMGSLQKTVVFGASQQRQAFKDGGAEFHRGKFDYLMADGHVELLSPLQTGALDGTAGIWSLKKRN